ncbi:hypothetical protein BAE44_0009697 [Dichanthelium oligosanthes]|uniref:Uncharacterized protein n=1 Tax=Dichanthelium oligosanthes TaxID=888268 RepID=A0A1E5VW04_9POAL|nr:hypothetical protein BAE44_0009697 [Dichanthelium oligosanthes]
MARHLVLHLHAIAAALPASSGHPGAALAAVAAFLAVCALALALCASHSAPGPGRLRRALASVSRRRTEPVIMVAAHQVQPGGGEASPACVWQRGILMGGKCQLPDFSGVINYDPAGNLVAPARPGRAVPALGW